MSFLLQMQCGVIHFLFIYVIIIVSKGVHCHAKHSLSQRCLVSAHFRAIIRPVYRILCFVDRASPYSLTNNPTRYTILFKYIYSFLFSTCFGHPSAHHQRKITVSTRHWYLSLCMGGVCCAGWISIQPADQTPPIQSDKYQCCIIQ